MHVRILFFGILKDLVGRAEETVAVEPGATPGSIFQAYAVRYETLRDKRPSILFARNREFTTPDAILEDNDEVAFLPPVSGGSVDQTARVEDESGNVFALTREPIESSSLASRLQRPEDGAVVVFEGIVRNNTRGRATKFLEYDCYESMAIEQIARIGREIAQRFQIGRIGIMHRLGRIEIGQASVVVIATAPHRRPAFEAALDGIDRLKKEVPIWKKEFFADGAVWVDGEWDERLRSGLSQE